MKNAVDLFISEQKNWKKEFEILREIILSCGLEEELKWKQPCYTYGGKNMVILGGFKNYCMLAFFKGALIKDEEGILEQQTDNVQATRVIKFTKPKEIIKIKDTIKSFIFQAIEIEKSGAKISYKKTEDFKIPIELSKKLKASAKFKKAFESLTPGRQKAYILFFSSAKQTKTIESRIEKYTERILKGKGLLDCVCGLSKKYPACDGSHQQLKNKFSTSSR
ncbi:MAG: DUF1801 domain-containing protein [Sphingobacteriaceae bacterium]|nr:DUF1801 domain-containing protein [Sphingobacteriaceae bacterium]